VPDAELHCRERKNMDTQICNNCGTEKPLEDFYYSKNNLRGYATICLNCVKKNYIPRAIPIRVRKSSTFIYPDILPKTEIKNSVVKEKKGKEKISNQPLVIKIPVSNPHPKRRGFVYLMQADNGLYKIGMSADIKKRLKDINRDVPVRVRLIHYIASDYQGMAEAYLHTRFKEEREKYEWFKLTQDQVNWICSLKDYSIDPWIK
jgi:hypothetical protein